MATTPNYGFIMPDPTDFVTDLPADFEIFGDEVDARIKALNPETTLGDISYHGSTANAKTRLGIGTAGQVLTVNSGATAPEWKTPAGSSDPYLTNKTAGRWMTPLLADKGFGSNAASIVGRTCYTPIYLPNCTLDRIAVRTQTFTGQYTTRLGIYNNTDGKPSTVLLDAGTVLANAGNSDFTITINQTITAGWYWLAANTQVEVVAGTREFLSTTSGAGKPQFFSDLGGPGFAQASGFIQTGVTGAFATASPTVTDTNLILVYVRLA